MLALSIISLLGKNFSNVGNTPYELAKYLAKLLPPLRRSQYMVNSTKEFLDMIKNERIPNVYKMISFDVSSLFTVVLLDYAIDLTLEQIYRNKEIETKI